jgi:hypothetical protein
MGKRQSLIDYGNNSVSGTDAFLLKVDNISNHYRRKLILNLMNLVNVSRMEKIYYSRVVEWVIQMNMIIRIFVGSSFNLYVMERMLRCISFSKLYTNVQKLVLSAPSIGCII